MVDIDNFLSTEEMLKEISPIAGYAFGGYWVTCTKCGRKFDGDKRASQCLPCVVKTLTALDTLTMTTDKEFYEREHKFAQTEFGKLFKSYENALAEAWRRDTELMMSDEEYPKTKSVDKAWNFSDEKRKLFLTRLMDNLGIEP